MSGLLRELGIRGIDTAARNLTTFFGPERTRVNRNNIPEILYFFSGEIQAPDESLSLLYTSGGRGI
jgi:hypothetical protein